MSKHTIIKSDKKQKSTERAARKTACQHAVSYFMLFLIKNKLMSPSQRAWEQQKLGTLKLRYTSLFLSLMVKLKTNVKKDCLQNRLGTTINHDNSLFIYLLLLNNSLSFPERI